MKQKKKKHRRSRIRKMYSHILLFKKIANVLKQDQSILPEKTNLQIHTFEKKVNVKQSKIKKIKK